MCVIDVISIKEGGMARPDTDPIDPNGICIKIEADTEICQKIGLDSNLTNG